MQPELHPCRLDVAIRRQPDDATCGPTCLHAVYRYYGRDVRLDALVDQVPTLPEGGTLGVLLARDALTRGFRTRLITWNLRVFDPTWMDGDHDLGDRLARRAAARADDVKLRDAALAYQDYLAAGGEVAFRDLDRDLLRSTLEAGVPILTGLSATFLYREARQRADDVADDIAGDPVGHFVVLTGYDPKTDAVYVTDPLHPNALSEHHTYPVPVERVIGAIYLGVLTYDANLLLIGPPEGFPESVSP